LKAIDNLPLDERKAVVLCHVLEYEEESDDPSKTTAATLCGVTGRTIRNRLSRAAKKLSPFKENR
jgi:DNA-directed RNA polymerase specialized sigma24 family protein